MSSAPGCDGAGDLRGRRGRSHDLEATSLPIALRFVCPRLTSSPTRGPCAGTQDLPRGSDHKLFQAIRFRPVSLAEHPVFVTGWPCVAFGLALGDLSRCAVGAGRDLPNRPVTFRDLGPERFVQAGRRGQLTTSNGRLLNTGPQGPSSLTALPLLRGFSLP